jgi:non-canonical (house-cleaning) NTP pyrophosphatase
MRRISHTRIGSLALALVLSLTATVAVVSAFWTSSGQGSVAANLATLPAPAIVSTATGAETVELSWSAITAPGEGTVEYYVTRDGATASAGCPGSSAHTSATSCTDTHVPVGAHKYLVTAVWRSWTSAGEEKTVTIAFGAATHLVLEAASTTPAAGEADNLTILAKDASGNTVGTYSGAHNLVFEGAGESASGEEPTVVDSANVAMGFGESTEITFVEGRASVSSAMNGVMRLYKAEAAHVKVKEGALTNGAGLAVTVKAAATTKKLAVSAIAEQTAGTAFNVTLTATDEYGNTTTSYAGAKTIAWSGPASSPSGKAPSYPASVTFTTGVGTASGLKLYDAQSVILKAKEGATVEGASSAFTVKPAVTKKLTVPTPSEQEAGVAFGVTLTATDEYGNIATSYAGAKTLVWSGPASAPSGQVPEYSASATTVAFVEGVGAAAVLRLYDAQSVALKVKEGATVEGASASFTIKAAAAGSFSVPTPIEQTAGTAFNVTVTAWDAWHNTAKNYAGAKALLWSEPASSPNGKAPSYPATVTFSAGAGTASIKLYDAQSTTLKAGEGTIEGASGSFTVKAAVTKKFTVPTPAEQEAGVAFGETLTATDEYGNLAKSYTGAKTLVWSNPASAPGGQAPEYPASAATVTFTEGAGTASALKLYDAQTITLKVKEGATVEGVSGSFVVKAGVAERLAWSHAEVTAGSIEAGSCPFACKTTSIGAGKKFKARASVTDRYGNVVSNLGASGKAKVEKSSGEGTLANATGLTVPAAGLAESATTFEYTSPASGTSEAVLTLKAESGLAYTEGEAHVKY